MYVEPGIMKHLPGEVVTWGDGKDQAAVASPMVFAYDHADAPAWFDEATPALSGKPGDKNTAKHMVKPTVS